MRGDWIVTIAVLVVAAIAYALTWKTARERGARMRLDRALRTKVGDVMSSPPITARKETTVQEAAATMLRARIGCLPVLDDRGGLAGIVTESDLSGARIMFGTKRPATAGAGAGEPWIDDALERIFDAARHRSVAEVMTRRVVTASDREQLSDVALRMIERRLHRLPVVRDGTLVGVVSRRDLLTLLTG